FVFSWRSIAIGNPHQRVVSLGGGKNAFLQFGIFHFKNFELCIQTAVGLGVDAAKRMLLGRDIFFLEMFLEKTDQLLGGLVFSLNLKFADRFVDRNRIFRSVSA